MNAIPVFNTDPTPAYWRRLAGRVGDLLLPPLCLVCHDPLANTHSLCAGCWSRLNFIVAPSCQVCGVPFEHGAGGSVCLVCLDEPPSFDCARAALVYDDTSRPLLLAFKHGDRTLAGRLLARWLFQAGSSLIRAADWIAPVPLHRERLWRRRYNQAAILGQELADLAPTIGSRAIAVGDLLRRIRATPRQQGNRQERERNVAKAFALRERHAQAISGKSIILVDDVLTTGATANGCADVLLKAGAAKISVLTVARVARP